MCSLYRASAALPVAAGTTKGDRHDYPHHPHRGPDLGRHMLALRLEADMTILLSQIFKTSEGARKRAAFENAHPQQFGRGNRYWYSVVRCLKSTGQPDKADFDAARFNEYVWRLERKRREQLPQPSMSSQHSS